MAGKRMRLAGMGKGIWICAVAAAAVMAWGCVRRPSGVASDKEFAPVVADMELAEAYMQTQTVTGDRTAMREGLVAGVLDKHGMSREEFDRTMDWYAHNVDAYSKLDAQVKRELDKRRRSLSHAGGGRVSETSGNDLWPYSRTAVLSEKSGSDVLAFTLPGGELKPGMTVTWKMRLRGRPDVGVLLGVEYEDGSLGYLYRPIPGERRMEMTLQTDTALKVKRVYGHLLARKREDMPVWVDSIALESAPLDTARYYKIHGQRRLGRPFRTVKRQAVKDTVGQSAEKRDVRPATEEPRSQEAETVTNGGRAVLKPARSMKGKLIKRERQR